MIDAGAEPSYEEKVRICPPPPEFCIIIGLTKSRATTHVLRGNFDETYANDNDFISTYIFTINGNGQQVIKISINT